MFLFSKPKPGEYAEFYQPYIDKIAEQDILSALGRQEEVLQRFFEELPEEKHEFRYAEGKWTPKEILGHIIDAERIFAYRALRISRGDSTPLSGFDEDEYVRQSAYNDFSIPSLVAAFGIVRQATIALLVTTPEGCFTRMGSANGKPVSVRALYYIILGHAEHHLGVLREKYC